MAEPSGQFQRTGAARRRRERRLRSMLRHELRTVRTTALARRRKNGALRGLMTAARAGDVEEQVTHAGLRAPKTPPPGARPGILAEPGPQRSDGSKRHFSGDNLLTLGTPSLAAGEAVDSSSLRFLTAAALRRWKEEEESKAGLEALQRRAAELAEQRKNLTGGSSSTQRRRKKRKKKLPKTSSCASSSRADRTWKYGHYSFCLVPACVRLPRYARFRSGYIICISPRCSALYFSAMLGSTVGGFGSVDTCSGVRRALWTRFLRALVPADTCSLLGVAEDLKNLVFWGDAGLFPYSFWLDSGHMHGFSLSVRSFLQTLPMRQWPRSSSTTWFCRLRCTSRIDSGMCKVDSAFHAVFPLIFGRLKIFGIMKGMDQMDGGSCTSPWSFHMCSPWMSSRARLVEPVVIPHVQLLDKLICFCYALTGFMVQTVFSLSGGAAVAALDTVVDIPVVAHGKSLRSSCSEDFRDSPVAVHRQCG